MGYSLFSVRRELRIGRRRRVELRRIDDEERVQSGDEYPILRDGIARFRKVKKVRVDSVRKNLPNALRLTIFII